MLVIVVSLRLTSDLFVFFIAERGTSNDTNSASNQSTFASTILLVSNNPADGCSGDTPNESAPFGVRVRSRCSELLSRGDICEDEPQGNEC
jgi:hypothetical protein